MALSQWTYKLWSVVALLGFLFSPLQPLAAAGQPIASQAGALGQANKLSYEVSTSGLYRTTITLRTPADWARLEKMGVVVDPSPSPSPTRGGESGSLPRVGGGLGWGSAVVLADDAQLEALACLRFEPRASDDAEALIDHLLYG